MSSVHQLMRAFVVLMSHLLLLVQPNCSIPSAQLGHCKISCSMAHCLSFQVPLPRYALHSLLPIQPTQCTPNFPSRWRPYCSQRSPASFPSLLSTGDHHDHYCSLSAASPSSCRSHQRSLITLFSDFPPK